MEYLWNIYGDIYLWYNDLVGGIATPPKNMNVNWDDDIPNWMGQ